MYPNKPKQAIYLKAFWKQAEQNGSTSLHGQISPVVEQLTDAQVCLRLSPSLGWGGCPNNISCADITINTNALCASWNNYSVFSTRFASIQAEV